MPGAGKNNQTTPVGTRIPNAAHAALEELAKKEGSTSYLLIQRFVIQGLESLIKQNSTQSV